MSHNGNTLDGITDHARDFVQSLGLRWIQVGGSGYEKPPQQVLLSVAPSPLCSPSLPLPLCDCSRALTGTSESVILHPFGHYAFSSATSLTLNLNFPFLIFFHVTVSFGGLSNPLTLVFTPSQHQRGVPMIWGRHHFTGLYYSVHILFILHKPFSQASSSIYFSLF